MSSVFLQDYRKTTGLIFIKLGGLVKYSPGKKPVKFGSDPDLPHKKATNYILTEQYYFKWRSISSLYGTYPM